ncbi:MAG: FTR1 family protein [Actinobacteria bacterium]|nr:FTR1 family protein [Actinomycetota bacterium]
MITAMLIMIREGVEAALIVAVLAVYLRRIDRPDLRRDMWRGIAAATVIASIGGVVIHSTLGDLPEVAELRAYAGIGLFAAAVLTWMVFWMRANARGLSSGLRERMSAALSAGNVRLAVFTVAFVAVIREMLEAALFLVATATTDSGGRVLLGGVIGIAIAVAIGVVTSVAGRRLPMRAFFRVTGAVVILFAAGLLARAVLYLQEIGDVGSLWAPVYDLSRHRWLTDHTAFGEFLTGMVGWDPTPSLEQVLVWLGYVLPIGWMFLRERTPVRSGTSGPVAVTGTAGTASDAASVSAPGQRPDR